MQLPKGVLHKVASSVVVFSASLLACTPAFDGDAAMERGDYGSAITAYSDAIEENPSDYDLYNNRGVAYAEIGQHEDAVADYNEAVLLFPTDSTFVSNRGSSYPESTDGQGWTT